VGNASSAIVNAQVSGPGYGNVNNWTFFAVTYDGSLVPGIENVKFYRGDFSGGESNAVLVSSHTLRDSNNDPVNGSVGDDNQRLNIGQRPVGVGMFDGWLDVLRIFGSKTDGSGALSLGEIQYWQSQVPEPSVAVLLAVAGCLLLRRRSNRE
jgi:hypothetical protein